MMLFPKALFLEATFPKLILKFVVSVEGWLKSFPNFVNFFQEFVFSSKPAKNERRVVVFQELFLAQNELWSLLIW